LETKSAPLCRQAPVNGAIKLAGTPLQMVQTKLESNLKE